MANLQLFHNIVRGDYPENIGDSKWNREKICHIRARLVHYCKDH